MPEPDWYYEAPKFWDESVWEKVPLSEDGLTDFKGILNLDKTVTLADETFGSLPPDKKLGFGQLYKKIGEENFKCVAITFFDYDEPVLLFWSKENEPAPFLGQAVKYDNAWVVVRQLEGLNVFYAMRPSFSDVIDEIRLAIVNIVNSNVVLSVDLKRSND